MWNLGSVKYCLNQASRPDRWEQAQAEFKRIGMEGVERFLSLPADQPYKSFCLSQYAMLKAFLATGKETLLALEDDVVFRNLDTMPAAVADLPENWLILYLGANITDMVFGIKENPPVKCEWTNRLFWIRRAWTTHAIAYKREAVKWIVDHYPVHTFQMYDNWLSEIALPELRSCYLVNPMVAYQRPGKSDLWGMQTDYTGAFDYGNKIMSRC